MKNLDKELAYAVVCYPDFASTKNYNENFILTRQKTIIKGNDYCDFCYHDQRIQDSAKHPPEEYFKNLLSS